MTIAEPHAPEFAAGRACPLDYLTPLTSFRRAADIKASTVYVVGGLYGNIFALDAVEALATREPGAKLVFNGDCHWFDRDLALFSTIEQRLAPYLLLRGNVETEISRDRDIGAGCGCAYPTNVDQGIVDRSNRILASLAVMLADQPALRARLASRPATAIADIGGTRVGIVHGDAHSLAGWSFDRGPLDDPAMDQDRRTIQDETGISIFASTHTCTAVMRHFSGFGGAMTIANNGGAGLPNFGGSRYGLVTRLSIRPAPFDTLYGVCHGNLHIDAVALAYDHAAFLAQFDQLWPAGSDAALSYRQRILGDMAHSVADAAPLSATARTHARG